MPTEQELTALATDIAKSVADGDFCAEYQGSSDKLAAGYLALLAERDALKADRDEREAHRPSLAARLAAVEAERDHYRELWHLACSEQSKMKE